MTVIDRRGAEGDNDALMLMISLIEASSNITPGSHHGGEEGSALGRRGGHVLSRAEPFTAVAWLYARHPPPSPPGPHTCREEQGRAGQGIVITDGVNGA